MANYTQRPASVGVSAKKKPCLLIRMIRAIIPWKGDGVGEVIRKIIFAGALVAFIITGGTLLGDVTGELWQKYVKTEEIKNLKAEGSINLSDEQIAEIQSKVPEILPEYMSLYSQNNDFVGWVKIDGTILDYPVVQTTDNDVYLKKTFTGETSKGGTIFADYRNTVISLDGKKKSDNIILYGHNIWSGAMFTELTRYLNDLEKGDAISYYKTHPTIEFDTIYEKGTYKVFAYALFNTQEEYGEVFDYNEKREFANADEFNNFILDIMDRSVIWPDVDLQYGDELLTLSTCYWPYGEKYDTRCAVFARKVRDGESAEVNVDAAQLNVNPLMWEYQYRILGGGSWAGRRWDTSKLIGYTAPESE